MARKKDDSLFDMFQDPIMTMIALILLSTLWMIIPCESKEKSPAYYERKASIDSLRSSINIYDKEINMLEIKLRRVKRELDWTTEKADNQVDTQSTNADSLNNDVIRSSKELQEKLRRGKEELHRLERMIAKARKKAALAPGGEAIRSLFQEINATQGILDKKMKELVRIENQRIDAENKGNGRKSELGSLQSHHDELLKEIELKRDKKELLENELDELGENEAPGDEMKSQKGFTVVGPTDKKIFYMHLRNNALLPVDDQHYSVETGYIKMKNGRMVSAEEQSPLASAQWESVAEIENGSGAFKAALKKLSPEKYCIIFLVDTRSFHVFRNAREIARGKGFEVGWKPFTNNSIVLVSRGEGDEINVEKMN